MAWMKALSVAAVLTLMSAPAFAQHTRSGSSESRGRAESRGSGEARGGGEARGSEARGSEARGSEARGVQQAPAAPRAEQAPPQRNNGGRAVPRAVPSAPPNVGRDNRSNDYGHGQPNGRPYVAPRGSYAYPRGGYSSPRGGYAVPRSTYPTYPRSYGYGYRPRVIVPVVPYYRPYYTFRPRFSVGFGIYLGYPVPYPYSYGYPTYVYGAGEYTPYSVAPTPGSYGGISFDITPGDADIYIDGSYVGRVADFSPMYQPLTVTPGRHQVELDAPGCEPLVFEVDIQPGQVLPYRGALRPY